MIAVIQAGGKGARLRPYTLVLPKPLMPVAGVPVIELLIKWLRKNGVHRTYITTGYLSHLIRSVCGDGGRWDMDIEYTEESEPLGTMGPLHLLGPERLVSTFLVLNGDVITDLNLRDFIRRHRQSGSLVTVAITSKDIKVNLGVLDCDNGFMVGFREKPLMDFNVSMGVYCMEPGVLDLIPRGVPFGFDDLMHTMIERKLPVAVYRHRGLWIDIGLPEDFQRAQDLVLENGSSLLGVQ